MRAKVTNVLNLSRQVQRDDLIDINQLSEVLGFVLNIFLVAVMSSLVYFNWMPAFWPWGTGLPI